MKGQTVMLNAHQIAELLYGPVGDRSKDRRFVERRACNTRRWLNRRGLKPAGAQPAGPVRTEAVWDRDQVLEEIGRPARSEAAKAWRVRREKQEEDD